MTQTSLFKLWGWDEGGESPPAVPLYVRRNPRKPYLVETRFSPEFLPEGMDELLLWLPHSRYATEEESVAAASRLFNNQDKLVFEYRTREEVDEWSEYR